MTGQHPACLILGALALVAALLAPVRSAMAEGYRPGPPRPCDPAPCRRPPPPPGFGHGRPPVIVQGYLPRTHALPMYNEPPARPPAW